jgi:hypothetical protein
MTSSAPSTLPCKGVLGQGSEPSYIGACVNPRKSPAWAPARAQHGQRGDAAGGLATSLGEGEGEAAGDVATIYLSELPALLQ